MSDDRGHSDDGEDDDVDDDGFLVCNLCPTSPSTIHTPTILVSLYPVSISYRFCCRNRKPDSQRRITETTHLRYDPAIGLRMKRYP